MTTFELSFNGNNFSIEVMTVVLFLTIFVLIILLYRAQKYKTDFDLRDLIIDKDNGRVSLSRFGQFIALMVSTWGFITLTLNNGLTEWYYTSYMAVWAIAEGFRKWGKLQIGRDGLKENTRLGSGASEVQDTVIKD